ncbi:hypothetical protein ACIODW_00660 [Streptomyces sp. NPDC087897]|uniref:hypothetical protein n=1 Tax=Streptomyces sp. NPDC087897 TaxID=3365817 RepID=UPI0038255ECA
MSTSDQDQHPDRRRERRENGPGDERAGQAPDTDTLITEGASRRAGEAESAEATAAEAADTAGGREPGRALSGDEDGPGAPAGQDGQKEPEGADEAATGRGRDEPAAPDRGDDPPAPEGEDRRDGARLTPRQARRLRILLSSVGMAAMAVVLVLRIASRSSVLVVGVYGLALVLCGVMIELSRNGRTRMASWLLGAGLLAAVGADWLLLP